MKYSIDYILTDEERQALVDANIDFREATLGSAAYHRHVVIFNESAAPEVTETLNLLEDPGGQRESLSSPDGEEAPGEVVVLPLIEFPTKDNPIVWQRWQRSYDWMENVFASYLGELGVGVVVRKFNGTTKAPYRHRVGTLLVNIYSAPEQVRDIYFERGFSMVEGRADRIVIEGLPNANKRITAGRGQDLAIFRGNAEGGSLWLLFSPEDFGDGEGMLDFVLYNTARLMHPELGELKRFEEFAETVARQRYIRRAAALLENEIDGLEGEEEEAEEDLEVKRQEFIQAIRDLELIREREWQVREYSTAELISRLTEKLTKEFDNLMASGYFEFLNYGDQSFTARTRPLVIVHEGERYNMGRYDIKIDNHRDSVRIFSADGVNLDGYSHPHVKEGGQTCFGNLQEGMAKLLAEQSYSVLLPLVVRFLEEGYNPTDSYIRVEKFWRRRKKKEVKR